MKVYKTPCKNCLLSKDAIVSPQRRGDLLNEIRQNGSYFVCHVASMKGEDVCCRRFYDQLGHESQLVRIAQRLKIIEEVEQPESDRLTPWNELNKPD